MEIFFRFNPFAWRLGLCIPSAKAISINRQIIYTLTGPITSLLIAFVACYFTFSYDLHGFLKLFLIVFLGSSIFDLFINLIPIETPIKLYDGTFTHNDGYNLKRLFYYKSLPKEYIKAAELYQEQRYSEAAILFDKILSNGFKDENIYRLTISSYLLGKNYQKSKELSDEFIQLNKMNSDDLSNAAFSYSQLELHEQAMNLYDKSLEQNPNNKNSLNNKGYTLNLLNRYEEAISFFDKAIELDKDFAYSYNNRGLSKIKIGKQEDGLKDINYSLELDKDNSYGYRNLGIYHFDKGEYHKALQLFTKAMELDSSTHLIGEFITETKKHL
ncbi:MAG TPA: tetratricopeptide repeat protein [Chitinophagaceae bacterium]|nr:tetratricopeptide repeat protein [Chitinophagaceae bacterium]